MATPTVKLMRAVQYGAYGGSAAGLKHVEVSIPSPKQDEVLLKVEASSINPIDWKVQKGVLRPILPRKFPFVPVTDVAGEVVEVSPGVSSLKTGDKVVTVLGIRQSGGFADYAAAGLPIAGLTALQTLQSAGVKFDGTNNPVNILVTIASGGVGHYVVQLAKLGNCHITATCSARNIDLVKSLGIDEILDYKTPAGAALQSPLGKKYDAVIHCASGIPWSTFEPNLAENGKVIDITPNATAFLTAAIKKITFSTKQFIPLFLSAKKEELEFLVGLVKEGKLKQLIPSARPRWLGPRAFVSVNFDGYGELP